MYMIFYESDAEFYRYLIEREHKLKMVHLIRCLLFIMTMITINR